MSLPPPPVCVPRQLEQRVPASRKCAGALQVHPAHLVFFAEPGSPDEQALTLLVGLAGQHPGPAAARPNDSVST